MVKLPDRSREMVGAGAWRTRCWVCQEIIKDNQDIVWFQGQPAHETCVYEEENP